MFSGHDSSLFWDKFDKLLAARNYPSAYSLLKISLISPSRTFILDYFTGDPALQSARGSRLKALIEWKSRISLGEFEKTVTQYTRSADQQSIKDHNTVFRTETLELYKTLIRTHYETDIQRQGLFSCFILAAGQLTHYYQLLRQIDKKHPHLSENLSNHNSTQSMECLELIYGAYALAYSVAKEDQKKYIERQRERFIAEAVYHHAELFWKEGLNNALRSKDQAKFSEWLNGLSTVTEQLKAAGYLSDDAPNAIQLTDIFKDEFYAQIMGVHPDWYPLFLEKFHQYLGAGLAPSPQVNDRKQLLEARQLFIEATPDNIADIQYNFSNAVSRLLRKILMHYVRLLGPPPKNFGFFILGSLSTYKALPGSDVEYLLLIDDKQQHLDRNSQRYFDSLWTLFAIHICEMGEIDGFRLDGLSENHAGTHMRGITTARLQYLLEHTEQDYDEGLRLRDPLATSFLSARCLVEFSTSALQSQASPQIEAVYTAICKEHESTIYTGPAINNNRLPSRMTNGQARVIARLIHARDILLAPTHLAPAMSPGIGAWRYEKNSTSLALKNHGTQPLLVLLQLLAVYHQGSFTNEMRSLDDLMDQAFPSSNAGSYRANLLHIINTLHCLRAQNHLENHFQYETYILGSKPQLLSQNQWNIFYAHVITPLFIAIKDYLEDPSKDFPADPPIDNLLKINNKTEDLDVYTRMQTAAFTWVMRYMENLSALTQHFNVMASTYWDTLSLPLRRLFYQALTQLTLPNEFHSVQQQLAWLLAHRPQADGWRLQTELEQLEWDDAVEILFEPEEPSDVTLSNNGDMVYLQLIITTPDSEKVVTRALKASVINQLFASPGVFKEAGLDFAGRHRVLAIEQNGYCFGIKFDPEHPSAEVATYTLNQRINGQGVPIGSVGHLQYKTATGIKSVPIYLMPNIRKNKPFAYNARRLTDESQGWALHINPISYAQHLFRVLILGASDDRPTDYFLCASSQNPGTYDLVRLDNERMLGQSTYSRSLLGTLGSAISQGRVIGAGTGVQMASILFCMNQLYEPLPDEVLEEIASLDITQLLKAWAKELNLHTISLHGMFPDVAAKDYFNREQKYTYAALYLPEDQIRKLVIRLEEIQTQIHRYFLSRQIAKADDISCEPLRAVDIFRHVYPEIATAYEKNFILYPSNPENEGVLAQERFEQLDKDNDVQKTTIHQGKISTQASLALVASHSRALGRPMQWEDIEHVRKGRRNSVKNALGIFESFDPIAIQGTWDRIIAHAESGNKIGLKQAISDFRKLLGSRKKLDLIWRFSKKTDISIAVQQAILEAMQGLAWVHFKAGPFAAALTKASLDPILVQAKDKSNKSTIVKLEIENADNLSELDFSTLPGVYFGSFEFSSLKVLIIRNCKNISRLGLYAPLLEELILENCPNLTVVEVNSASIKNGKITGCDRINKNSLSILAKQKFEPAEMMMRRLYPVYIPIGSMDFSSRVVSRREIEPPKVEVKPPSDLLIKAFLLGDPGVGKSVLLEKYTEGKFNPSSNVTIGILYKEIVLNEVNYSEDPDDRSSNFDCRLQVFDRGGQERFQSGLMFYYRGVSCFIICYDTTNKESFKSLSRWVRQAKGFNTNKHAKFLIVGTQADIKEARQVDEKEAEKVSKELGAFAYIECSSKYNVNLNEVFIAAARAGMRAHMDEVNEAGSQKLVTMPKKKIPLADRKAPNKLLLKISLAGSEAGKTNLIKRYTEGTFVQNFVYTTGVDFDVKILIAIQHPESSIDPDELYDCKLQIWDLGCSERFASIRRVYYPNSDCIILCYDINAKRTFLDLEKWYFECKSNASKHSRYLVIGTRSDLNRRQVTYEEGQNYAKKIGAIGFFECSAKDNTNIDELFLAATHAAIEARTDKFNDGIPVKKLEPEKPKLTLAPAENATFEQGYKSALKAAMELNPRTVDSASSSGNSLLRKNVADNVRKRLLNIIMLGTSGSGKTMLLNRYVNKKYIPGKTDAIGYNVFTNTIQIAYPEYSDRPEDQYNCELRLQDPPGQETFSSLYRAYYRGKECFILCFDVTDKNSFKNLDFWFKNYQEYGDKNAKYIVVANKIDNVSKRVVTVEEGEAYAKSIGAYAYRECSAKEDRGVEQLFLTAARAAMEVPQRPAPRPTPIILDMDAGPS